MDLSSSLPVPFRGLRQQHIHKILLPVTLLRSGSQLQSRLFNVEKLLQEGVHLCLHLLLVGNVPSGRRDPFEPGHEVTHHPGGADGEQRLLDQFLELPCFDLSCCVHPKEPANQRKPFLFNVNNYFQNESTRFAFLEEEAIIYIHINFFQVITTYPIRTALHLREVNIHRPGLRKAVPVQIPV